MKRASLSIMAIFAILSLTACDVPARSSDQQQRQAQEQLSAESNMQVGMPAISHFTEKRNYKMIYELRDKPNYATYTYLVGLHNEYKLLCHSIGYGIPESSQYTNPQRVARQSETPDHGNVTLPQADPNGLFSSSSSNGTWVMCLDSKTGNVAPVRVEPNVVTSPFPLE